MGHYIIYLKCLNYQKFNRSYWYIQILKHLLFTVLLLGTGWDEV